MITPSIILKTLDYTNRFGGPRLFFPPHSAGFSFTHLTTE